MSKLAARTGLYPDFLSLSTQHVKEQLGKSEPIASGAFGDIHEVTFEGEVLCIKMSRANKQLVTNLAKTFRQEGIIWSRLSHPNILPFYGLCVFDTQIALLAPCAAAGNIREFLRKPESNNPNRILLCADTAAGIKYLHEKEMVHGDLKAASSQAICPVCLLTHLLQENILVDRSGRACLADFGLSNVNDSRFPHWSSQSSVASKGGTSRYQAPELHTPESDDVESSGGRRVIHNSKATDVYAWGSLCYEVDTRALESNGKMLEI
ncbi:hypothetical protein C0991_010803 [Blastosporella zonata]|nr:hypothetical protein C0991_010803 [Blastosporella zonata]